MMRRPLRPLIWALFPLAAFSLTSCSEASKASPSETVVASQPAVVNVREFNSEIGDVRSQLHALKSEQELLDEKIAELDNTLVQLKSQMIDKTRSEQEAIKERLSALENKSANHEKKSEAILGDLRQLKNHANDTGTALAQTRTKLQEMDHQQKQAENNISHLRTGMESIVKAVDKPLAKGSAAAGSEMAEKSADFKVTYVVQAGDSLKKLAKQRQTTVEAIKQANNLRSDVIKVGQKLLLPSVEN